MDRFARMDVPSALRAAGFGLRLQRDEDRAFLERLYISVRGPEVETLGWPEQARRAFLTDQFRLQHTHYQTHYHDAEFLIVEKAGAPAGRLCIFRGPRDHRVVDIALLPEIRGGGVGGALLEAVQEEAESLNKTVSVHVEMFNPAQHLYRRLGFQVIGENGPYWLMQWVTA
jgi:ribosomal protein S18 acetylase RimI-like enzyme